jgi:peptidyl-prolyl cis-trans isomerase A (cyclophilin A)
VLLRLVVALALVGALAGCGGGGGGTSSGGGPTSSATSTSGSTTSTTGSTGSGGSLLHPSSLHGKAPASYTVEFKTTKGPFTVGVTRAWAPLGADRFYDLVRAGYYDGVRFFRVVPGFVVQFGIHPQPAVAQAWQNADIQDDPVKHPNTQWTVTFATAGPNTRTTQVFINLADNSSLDAQGFAPFGRVTSGMKTVARLYAGYGEQPTNAQGQMVAQGDAFIRSSFPKLDRIVTARVAG